jgi:hypothetical protein
MIKLFDQTPKPKLRLIASNSPGVRTITDPVELFTLLFQDIERDEPQVPVSDYIPEAKDELFHAIRDRKPPDFYLYWHRILQYGFDWERSLDETTQRCSINMLVFMGHMGQFTNRNPDVPVPLSLALEVLICVGETGGMLTFGSWKEHSGFSSTPDSIRRLGVRFDITIRGDRHGLDLSEWHKNSGII